MTARQVSVSVKAHDHGEDEKSNTQGKISFNEDKQLSFGKL